MLNSLANEVAAVIATSERPALARSQFDAALRDKLQGVAEYHPPRRREPFQPDIEFDRFKERLVLALFLAHQDPRLDAPIRRAANEAAAMAWTTPYPMLVLPELLKEMARRAIDWETQKGRVQAAHDKPATNTALS